MTSVLWFHILSTPQKERNKRREWGEKEEGVGGKGRRGGEERGGRMLLVFNYPPFTMFSTVVHYCFASL